MTAYVLKRKRPKYRKTVIDTATAGTYTFDVAKDRTAKIILVGGGGAGGDVWVGHSEGGGGGSGACVYIKAKLTAGTYTITNGAAASSLSGNGGNSTLSIDGVTLITAGGGYGGQGGNGVPGAGGTYSISDNVELEKTIIAGNGNSGGYGGNMVSGAGGDSLYKGYGRGGASRGTGTSGYIWVELTTDETDYDYKIDNDACYVLNMQRYVKHTAGDYNPKNVLVIGSPTITEQGVVSGFSTTNYICPTTFKPESSPWEMLFKVTTGEDVTTEQCIFGVEDITNQRAGFGMSVHNGFFSIRLMTASSGTSWTFGGDGTIAVQPNTTYNLKAGWDGNTYSLQVMKEGASTYITDISYTSSSPIYRISNENEDTIGVMMRNSSTIYPFLGSIDLSESYMKVDGQYYWTGFYTSDVEGYKAYNIVDPSWVSGSQTFNYTGALQTYTVPEGVTQIEVDCVGAKGYTGNLEGGLGGRVKTKLTVTPGQELKVWVGQAHSQITTPEYNASDIRTSSADITSEEGLLSRLIVAGGGGDGSQTNWGGGKGGHGGGLIGGSGREGYGTEATGGTQTAGGTGGTHGAVYGGGSGQGYPGTFGLGGATKKHDASYSGCGGAGWYGGGGGSVCSVNKKYYVNGVAGAGGSSYTDPELCSEVSHAQGFNDGNGYVKISYKVRRRF